MPNPKISKIYTTVINPDGATFTKVAEIEQFSIDDTGITGLEGDGNASVNADPWNISGVDTRNQPQGISTTIPDKSFYNHDMLAAKQAHYDRITGEWETREWGPGYVDRAQEEDHRYYPPLKHKTDHEAEEYADQHRGGAWDEAWDNFYPNPRQHNANIGKGHTLQALIWRAYPNDIHSIYTINGVEKTEEEAHAQADKYLTYHINKFNIPKNEIERRDYDDPDHSITNFYDTSYGPAGPDQWHLHAERYVKPLYDKDDNILGYSWQQEHAVPVHTYNLLGREKGFAKAQKDIEDVHKDLHDMNHNTRQASFPWYKVAEIEDTNYEGVGSVFGEGMGPNELSNNVADVEQGPKGPKGTENSTVQLPASLQGQSVLPDVTSWFTASNYFNDDDYKYNNPNDSRQNDDYNLGLSDVNFSDDDESDTDDEDDYTNPDNW